MIELILQYPIVSAWLFLGLLCIPIGILGEMGDNLERREKTPIIPDMGELVTIIFFGGLMICLLSPILLFVITKEFGKPALKYLQYIRFPYYFSICLPVLSLLTLWYI